MWKKRIVSCLLALVLIGALLPLPLAAAAGTGSYNGVSYSTDYTTWRQGDAAWGPTALGDVHTFAGSGCLISAIAIQMCASGAYDPASLNPGVLRDWFDQMGYISHSQDRDADALLSFGRMTSTSSPRFYFVSQSFFDTTTPLTEVCQKIDALTASGYTVVARVKYSGHFVAVGPTVGGTDARIYDPGVAAKQLLSEYDGTIGGLIWFKANKNGKDTILPKLGVPAAPKVTDLRATYGTGDSIAVQWSASSLATHYNIYVDQKQADGTWKENVQHAFYVSSPYSLKPLAAGSYRIKVQATNANNWTYANADYQYVEVKSGHLTVTYAPAGGTVATTATLVPANSTYALPTPTRSNAFFLGWYTSDGKLVTTGQSVGTKGHTLTARWDTGGKGFAKTATYKGQFKDVRSSDWYYDSIASVYAYGFMNGVESTKFQPKDQVTAAQAITMAARLRKLYAEGSRSFASSTPWYKSYADYALSKGVVSSLPKDMDAPLTRQEFAAILAGALPASALPEVNTVAAGSIPDVYKSDAAIYKLYRAGIFAGNDAAGTFRPNAPISRAEVATVLVRMADPNVRVTFSLK